MQSNSAELSNAVKPTSSGKKQLKEMKYVNSRDVPLLMNAVQLFLRNFSYFHEILLIKTSAGQ